MKAYVVITSYSGRNVKKLFLEKIDGFILGYKWNSKNQIHSNTHEVDLSALTHEGPLVGTDRNE